MAFYLQSIFFSMVKFRIRLHWIDWNGNKTESRCVFASIIRQFHEFCLCLCFVFISRVNEILVIYRILLVMFEFCYFICHNRVFFLVFVAGLFPCGLVLSSNPVFVSTAQSGTDARAKRFLSSFRWYFRGCVFFGSFFAGCFLDFFADFLSFFHCD